MADNTVSILIKAKNLADDAIQKAKSALYGLSDESRKTGQATERLGQSSQQASGGINALGASVSSYTRQLVALAGTYASLQGLKSALTAVLDTGGRFETLGVQMSTLMGSIEEGERATQWVKDFAANTPFSVEGVTQAFIKLKAMGLDPMDGSLQAVADQTAKLGGSQAELEGITLALGQAWSKEKLQAEEALQLIERGVPVWELLSEKLGIASADLQDMASKGQLGRQEIQLLIEAIGESSAGASEAMMSTWSGLTSNLSDTWNRFLDTIAQSGVLDYFKQQLDQLLAKTEEMAANGQLQAIAQDISNFFIQIGQTLKDTIAFITEYGGAIKNLITIMAGAKLAQFASGLTGIGAAAAGAVAGGFNSAATQAGNFAGALGKVSGFVRAGLYGILVNEILNVADAYGKAKQAKAELEQIEQDYADNTKDRLAILQEEARQIGLNIDQYGDNVRAIVAAIEAKRDEQDAIEDTTDALRDYDAEVAAAVEQIQDLVGETGLTVKQMQDLGTQLDTINGQFDAWSKGSVQGVDSVRKGIATLTDQELKDMKQALQQAFDAGIDKTDELQQKLKGLTFEQNIRAAEELGIKLQSSLDAAATKARENFEFIKNSGVNTATDIKNAFIAYAEAAIQANGGVITQALKLEAAMYGVALGADQATNSFNKLNQELEYTNSYLDQIEAKNAKLDAEFGKGRDTRVVEQKWVNLFSPEDFLKFSELDSAQQQLVGKIYTDRWNSNLALGKWDSQFGFLFDGPNRKISDPKHALNEVLDLVDKNQPSRPMTEPAPKHTPSSGEAITINLALGNNQNATGQFPDNAATRALLEQLKQAGMVSK